MNMTIARIDALGEKVGKAAALARVIMQDVLNENDKAWIEVMLLKELEEAEAVLSGKGGE